MEERAGGKGCHVSIQVGIPARLRLSSEAKVMNLNMPINEFAFQIRLKPG